MNSARLFCLCVLISVGLNLLSASQAQTLTGPVTEAQILENDRIYEIYLDRYQPDSASVAYLSSQKDSIEVVVFLGSWCRESKKYIPGLMKTLRTAKPTYIGVRYIAVDAQKKIPDKFLKMFDIKYIPTVVVLKGGQDVGRIIEEPQLSIEQDLVEILKQAKKS